MRRFVAAFILTVLVFSTADVKAQNNLEVGLRFGDNFAIDGTLPIAQAPRLHAAVYLDRFGFGAYGNWVFNLGEGPRNLRFYAGGGPEIFTERQFDVAVAGDLGVEWAFGEVPVTLGFDWRPSLRLTNGTDLHTGNWGFVARFMLGRGTFVAAD